MAEDDYGGSGYSRNLPQVGSGRNYLKGNLFDYILDAIKEKLDPARYAADSKSGPSFVKGLKEGDSALTEKPSSMLDRGWRGVGSGPGGGSGGGGDIEDALKPKGVQRKRVM